METNLEPERSLNLEPSHMPKNTGWAIFVSVFLAFAFYFIYRVLFTFVIASYAKYDPSFASGIGALIFMVFGTNVLAFMSGSIIAKRLFPKASRTGMFYGLATLLVVIGAMAILNEMSQNDPSIIVISSNLIVLAVTVFVLKITLLENRTLGT
jgi:hypothetical protein